MSERHETTTLDPARWQRLNEIFAAALNLEPDQENAFLRQTCDGDEDLQREVEAILGAARSAERKGFLATDLFAEGAQVLAANEVAPGTEIGPYRVIKEIGRGGMGAVYLAQREDFQQQVALKIIKRGMDTDAIVRRFVQERDVLASLNHPNIARLLDGGMTADSLPFIAMEYVEGLTITEFCDQKKLSIEERLRLFRKVCGAVTYAHQNLVVHRDIKPSNILVAPDGEPKLLDFGIAKLLSHDPSGHTIEPTVTGANLMTPEYASPEQIRGDRITTSSDIYSLGVLLYELLCGRRPFSFKNCAASEVLRIISEREPAAPSTAATTIEGIEWLKGETRLVLPETLAERRSEKPARLQRKLAGDLDNIVLMALRKEPLRRYQSVQQFAEDVKRHLEGRPVVACPATFSYRTAKFIERNRTATAFVSLALIAILAGLSIAVWQAVVARQERTRAERRSNEIRRLTDTLLKDLHTEVGALPGSSRAQEKLSGVSIEYLKGLARETNDPAVLRQLSEAYVLLGKQYGYESRNPEEVRANIMRGLEIARGLVANAPDDLESKRLLAKNLEEFDYFCEKEPGEKLKINRERVRLREEIAAATPHDAEAFYEVAGAYGTLNYLARLYDLQAEGADYTRRYVQAREREIELLEKTARTVRQSDLLSVAYSALGFTYANELNDLQRSETNYRRALEVAKALVAEDPAYRLAWTRLVAAHGGMASIRQRQADYQGALDHFRDCLRIVRDANVKVPNVQMQSAEPNYMLRVAENLFRIGKAEEALPLLREALAIHNRLNNFNRTSAPSLMARAKFLHSTGEVYAVGGRANEALATFREAETLWRQVPKLDASLDVTAKAQMASICIRRGEIYAANSAQRQEARAQYEQAINALSKLKAENQISLDQLKDLTRAKERLLALEG